MQFSALSALAADQRPNGWLVETVAMEVLLFGIAIAVGVLLLLVFKYVSNPQGLQRTRSQAAAYFLELRLYGHDAWLSLSALRRLFQANVRYLGLIFLPLLITALPIAILMMQLAAYYHFRPLAVGEKTTIEAVVREDVDVRQVELHSTSADILATVRMIGEKRIFWKIEISEANKGKLYFSYGEELVEVPLSVGGGLQRIHPQWLVSKFPLSMMFRPVKKLPPDAFIEQLMIRYPARTLTVIGLRANWLVFFLVVSTLTAVLLRRYFRVEF